MWPLIFYLVRLELSLRPSWYKAGKHPVLQKAIHTHTHTPRLITHQHSSERWKEPSENRIPKQIRWNKHNSWLWAMFNTSSSDQLHQDLISCNYHSMPLSLLIITEQAVIRRRLDFSLRVNAPHNWWFKSVIHLRWIGAAHLAWLTVHKKFYFTCII